VVRPLHLRATAALLASLLTLAPSLRAVAAGGKAAPVLVLPFTALSAPEASAARFSELLRQELRGRDAIRVVDLPRRAPPRKQPDAAEEARSLFAKAAEFEKKGKHARAAETLQKAIAMLTSRPLALDERGGRLLSDALVQLAVERAVAGDEEGADKALAQLVRISPDRELAPADYPPAFLRQHEAVRKRLLAAPRGSVRVLAPQGPGETRVFLDGRPFTAAPLLIKNVIPGEHFVRVERGDAAWAERVIAIAGASAQVAPQPGAEGPSAELAGALMQDEFDRAADIAARLTREAGAQAAVFGVAMRSGDSLLVKSFLARGDRVAGLPALTLNVELLGAAVELVKLADDLQAKMNAPPPENSVSASFASAAAAIVPEVQGAPLAPAPDVELPLTPLVAEAAPPPPEPARRVAMPGAPVAVAPAPPPPADTGLVAAAPKPAPAPEPPSRALVIPREPTRDDGDAPVARPRPAPAPEKRIAALEPDAIKTIRERPVEKKNHTLLWVLAGTLLLGGLAAGGYYLYASGQTPTSSTVTATWNH
jgi:tetratricopeptide (TPR) repeat protein